MSFFTEQAEQADDAEVKKIFRWLSEWERKHLELLMALDEGLRQRAWNDPELLVSLKLRFQQRLGPIDPFDSGVFRLPGIRIHSG